ncbi:MAG TPA: hypothetical protein VH482_14315 [Thermomicrobiales bacterium]
MDPNRPSNSASERPPASPAPPISTPPNRGRRFRLRWALYALVAVVALVPAIWQRPTAYPWDHDSPCVTQTAAAQTAEAEALSEPLAKPTVPGACVDLATLVARRKATSVP